MEVEAVRRELFRAGDTRSAAALVADDEHIVEVSVAPGRHWVARSHNQEWVGTPQGVRCWYVLTAGAREIAHDYGDAWVHPAVGMLWPELLPIWGREEDQFFPARVIESGRGPAHLVLQASEAIMVGGFPLSPGGSLDLDPDRWLCTRLDLPGRTWLLQEYRET